MKAGQFLIDSKDSNDYGILIQDRPNIETPKRRIELVSAYGQSGDNPFDEEAYDNTTLDLTLLVLGTNGKTYIENRNTVFELFNSGTYLDFIPYFDANKTYKVLLTNSITFVNKYFWGNHQAAVLQLSVKPYKYFNNSIKKTVTKGEIIINPYSQKALPLIKVVGTGDITLTVGGRAFIIKGLATGGHIWIDSEAMVAYSETNGVLTNMNNKVNTRDYPYLNTGNNKIDWTGTVTSVYIETRFRTLT